MNNRCPTNSTMRARFQTLISILVAVVTLTFMTAPSYLAWATSAHWPLSTITVPVTGPIQPAQSDGGWRFQTRPLNRQISISGAVSDLRRQGRTKQLGRFNNDAAPDQRRIANEKYMVINLIEVKDQAQSGKHLGAIVDLVMAVGKNEDGNDYIHLPTLQELSETATTLKYIGWDSKRQAEREKLLLQLTKWLLLYAEWEQAVLASIKHEEAA